MLDLAKCKHGKSMLTDTTQLRSQPDMVGFIRSSINRLELLAADDQMTVGRLNLFEVYFLFEEATYLSKCNGVNN